MHKKKLIIAALVLVMLMVPLTEGGIWDLYTSDALDRQSGVPSTKWYEVADWEIDVCMKWGGPKKVIDGGVGVLGEQAGRVMHNRIVTLQGERSEIEPIEGTETVVFEFAWFVQPLKDDEDISFRVILVKGPYQTEQIDSGSSNYVNPARGYMAIESAVNYTHVRLEYEGEGFEDFLQVEIV